MASGTEKTDNIYRKKKGQSGLEDSILPGAIAWLLLLFIEKQRIIKTSINRFE